MRIPTLNLRKKRGRKGESPLKYDPTLMHDLSRLQTINDYDSFETWRKKFLGRLGYFLVDECIERSEEAYHVTLRVKVDKLIRIVSKIARHVNDGSLSSTYVTVQARNSLNDGMKSCEDVIIYLQVLSPLTTIEENIVGFTKYNTVAVLVETSFKEYERLNMCKDILQVLRENFVNSVAEPKHLAAFNKYDQAIDSFKSVLLEDTGLLRVLKKQRQLKSPDAPKALVAEIRRGVLREALISKSLEAKQATQNSQEILDSNPTIRMPKLDRSNVDRMPKNREPIHYSEVFPGTDKAAVGEVMGPEQSIVDIKQNRRGASPANQNFPEKDPVNETIETKRNREKVSRKSPLKRRPTTTSPRRFLKQNVDDAHETNMNQSPSRRRKKSKSPKKDSSDSNSKMNRSSSRRRGVKNTTFTKGGNVDELSRSIQMLSLRNTSTPLNKTSQSKSSTARELIREEKGLSSYDSRPTKQAIIHGNKAGYRKPDSLTIFSKASSDDKSTSSSYRKKKSKIKAKKVMKGKKSLKNTVRERNIVTTRKSREALHKKEFSVDTLSFLHDEAKEVLKMKGEGHQYENSSQDAAVQGIVPRSSKGKTSSRNASRQKKASQNSSRIGSSVTGLQLDNGMPSNQNDSFGLSNNAKSTKDSLDKPKDGPIRGKEVHKKKKMVLSKSSKQKKTSWTTDDYKKIIHGKSLHGKKELPKLTMRWSLPVLVAEDTFLQKKSKPTENNSVFPRFKQLQMKLGKKLSSNIFLSLLDNCSSLNREEDELNVFQDTTPNREMDRSHANNGKFERCQPLLGHLSSNSASASFDHGNLQDKGKAIKPFDFFKKNNFERPSFYENFIKPLIMIAHDSTGNNEGESFHKDEERWEGGSDIFEDSVCSSKYKSGHSSIAKAIAKFNSDESIIELHRITEIRKQKDEAIEIQNEGHPETKSSSTIVTRSDDELVERMAEIVEPTERRKARKRRIEEIKPWNEHFFFENKEYSIYDQTKEILTAEEEAARMADEVANLQIALEDNHYALDCTALDNKEEEGSNASDEGAWKFKGEGEELEMVENMFKLEVREEELLTNSNDLDDEEEERNKASDDGTWKFKEAEELEMTEKMLKLEVNEDKLLTNCNDLDNKEEEGNKATDEGTRKFNEEVEELQMTENVLKLEINENNLLINCTDLNEEEGKLIEELEMAEKMLKLETLTLVASKHTRKNRLGRASRVQYDNESSFTRSKGRKTDVIVPDGSVRVYDPSARLSRW
jgi:hypothetical protein